MQAQEFDGQKLQYWPEIAPNNMGYSRQDKLGKPVLF